MVAPYWPEAVVFQFTPLREGRPGALKFWVRAVNFNSRPCVRGDLAATDTPHS